MFPQPLGEVLPLDVINQLRSMYIAARQRHLDTVWQLSADAAVNVFEGWKRKERE